MESFIKVEGGGKDICVVYVYNDDMVVGVIQVIKEVGLKFGIDIKVVLIDVVFDIFLVMEVGEVNVMVELMFNMVGFVFDVLVKYIVDGIELLKWIQIEFKFYMQVDDFKGVYEVKKGLGY